MRRLLVIALCCFGSTVAEAEVKQSSADAFFVSYSEQVSASAAKTYTDITQVQRWWDSEHTYSGKVSNLSLKPEAGGCFCERWKDGSVEHGRVIMALPGKLLRLEAALGPLQERALNGVLSFWIKNEDGATTLTVEYRVNGASTSGLDALAPSVDEMLSGQIARLKRYIGTGNPEPPPELSADDKDAKATPGAKPAKPKAKSDKPDAPAKR